MHNAHITNSPSADDYITNYQVSPNTTYKVCENNGSHYSD